MSELQQLFEASFKECESDKKELLIVDTFVQRLKEELPTYFKNWMNAKLTGEPALEPIARVNIGMDSSGYVSCGLFGEHNQRLISEGSGPNFWKWGLVSIDEGDYAFEERQKLVAQFLALCMKQALPEACKSPEFLALPRAQTVVFDVGAHSGWMQSSLYTYTGERHEIDHGNIARKRLRHEATCFTKEGTIERSFMDNVGIIDVQACAEQLIPVLNDMMLWVIEQKPEPLDWMLIAWSSNFDHEIAFWAGDALDSDDNEFRWPNKFDIYQWFDFKRPEDLDADSLSSVRRCVSCKIAEIACLASETLIKSDSFKQLPKTDQFYFEVVNRSGGIDPTFIFKSMEK